MEAEGSGHMSENYGLKPNPAPLPPSAIVNKVLLNSNMPILGAFSPAAFVLKEQS